MSAIHADVSTGDVIFRTCIAILSGYSVEKVCTILDNLPFDHRITLQSDDIEILTACMMKRGFSRNQMMHILRKINPRSDFILPYNETSGGRFVNTFKRFYDSNLGHMCFTAMIFLGISSVTKFVITALRK